MIILLYYHIRKKYKVAFKAYKRLHGFDSSMINSQSTMMMQRLYAWTKSAFYMGMSLLYTYTVTSLAVRAMMTWPLLGLGVALILILHTTRVYIALLTGEEFQL